MYFVGEWFVTNLVPILYDSNISICVPVQFAWDVAGARNDALIRPDSCVPPRETGALFRRHDITCHCTFSV